MAIVDRQLAIDRAIALARPDDVVLIAGKGHEKYQVIGDREIPFDDVAWRARRWRAGGERASAEARRSAAGGGDDADTLRRTSRAPSAAGCSPATPAAVVGGVSIDTRTLKPGDLYVAIRGERFDGHDFVEAALAAGAGGAIVSDRWRRRSAGARGPRLLVACRDTTRALQALARWVRRRSGARVVAITGSAGKTTTKEMTAAFLGAAAPGDAVEREPEQPHRPAAVAARAAARRRRGGRRTRDEPRRRDSDAGARSPSRTCASGRTSPRCTLEFFASIEAIADAKAEVLEGATAATVLVANADDPLVMARARGFSGGP